MSSRNWSGLTDVWSNATQWSGGLPGSADTAIFGGTGPYAVTFDTTATIAQLSGAPSNTTLDIATGLLTILGTTANSGWTSLLTQEGGTLAVANRTLSAGGTLVQTGGTIALALGAHLNQGGGTAVLGGAIRGLGTLGMGGQLTLQATGTSTAAFTFGSTSTITLGADQVIAGPVITTGGNLLLAGHALTLGGQNQLTSLTVSGAGTLALTGDTTNGRFNLHGPGTIVDAGSMIGDGFNVGNAGTGDTGTLSILPGATFDLRADGAVSGSNSAVIANAGLFEKSAGIAGTFSNVSAPLANTGTLRVKAGTLLLSNSGTLTSLGGTLEGPGNLQIGGNATLAAGAAVNVGTLTTSFGGTLTLAGDTSFNHTLASQTSSTIVLAGHSLTLGGAGQIAGFIDAQGATANNGSLFLGGTLDLRNSVFTGGTLWLEASGLVTQSAGVQLGRASGDHIAFQIDAGGTYHVTAAPNASTSSISVFNNGTTLSAGILNNGLFWYDGGESFNVGAAFANNVGGTVLVSKGTLAFGQSFVNDGSMLVSGAASFAGGAQASNGHVGTIAIGAMGTVTVNGAANATQNFDFQGAGGSLIINTPTAFAGNIVHFGAGDTIDVKARVNSWVESAGTVTLLNVNNGTTTTVGLLNGLGNAAGWGITEDGNNGSYVYGTAPSNTAVYPFHSPGTIDTAIPTAGTLLWNSQTAWTLGTPTGLVGANINTDTTAVVFGQDLLGLSTGTADTLNTGAASISLAIGSGNLVVLEGGTWISGAISITGGRFESVTGYNFGGPSFIIGAAGGLRSDSGNVTVNNTTFDVAGGLFGQGTVSATGTMTIEQGSTIDVASLVGVSGGTVVINGSNTLTPYFQMAGGLTLGGSTLTLPNRARLSGTVNDPGTVAIAGSADVSGLVLGGTSELLSVTGTAAETTNGVGANFANSITIAPSGVWDIQSDYSVGLHTNAANGFLVNSGLLEKTGGAGSSTLFVQLISTGTIVIATGTLNINGGPIDIGGTVTGAGQLFTGNFNSNLITTFEPGAVLSVASIALDHALLKDNLNYAGNLTTAGTVTLGGNSLTLTGTDSLAGSLAGAGLVDLKGAGDVNALSVTGTGTVLRVEATTTQSGGLVLGASSTADLDTLDILAGATFDQLTDANIVGTIFNSGAGTTTITGVIANAGLFEKTGTTTGGGQSLVTVRMINAGSILADAGSLAFNAALTNNAAITINGTLVANAAIAADLGHSGTIVINPTGTLIANAGVAADQTVTFDPGGLLQIAQPGSFAATIAGFAPGDRIEFTNSTAIASVSYAAGIATMRDAGNAVVTTLAMPGLTNPAGLEVSTDGTNVFLDEVACFAEGTRIATPDGPVPVERLRPGDRVLSAFGGAVRVAWLGHRHLRPHHHPNPDDLHPILISAGALAANVPAEDLWLSPDHALHIDGLLVPARHLVNGTTIRQLPVRAITYWHVELPQHDVILAAGAPCESYLDTGNRGAFANAATTDLHPRFASPRDAWEALACAPQCRAGPALEAIRARLATRAASRPAGAATRWRA